MAGLEVQRLIRYVVRYDEGGLSRRDEGGPLFNRRICQFKVLPQLTLRDVVLGRKFRVGEGYFLRVAVQAKSLTLQGVMVVDKVAYMRVSTEEQNETRQRESLEKHGIGKWLVEKANDKIANRLELQKMLDLVREGDTVYIRDLPRIFRPTQKKSASSFQGNGIRKEFVSCRSD